MVILSAASRTMAARLFLLSCFCEIMLGFAGFALPLPLASSTVVGSQQFAVDQLKEEGKEKETRGELLVLCSLQPQL